MTYTRLQHIRLMAVLAARAVRQTVLWRAWCGNSVIVIQAQGQEDLKYPNSTLLKSSKDLGWSTLLAELRSHSRLGSRNVIVEASRNASAQLRTLQSRRLRRRLRARGLPVAA